MSGKMCGRIFFAAGASPSQKDLRFIFFPAISLTNHLLSLVSLSRYLHVVKYIFAFFLTHIQEPVKKRGSRQHEKPDSDDDASSVCRGKKHCCSVCDMAFSRAHSLGIHERAVHLKEKPFPCSYCDKMFSRADALRTHEKAVHLKEKPHQCSFCDKMFAGAGHLRTHEKTVHLKEKPFRCSFCVKMFPRAAHLRTHEKSVHLKEKPH